MIALVQRVREASVEAADHAHREAIGPGLCVLLGVERGDGAAEADWIAGKLVRLRIFPDDDGRMNRDVCDAGGGVLVVSQFTLAGDCRKGNRPSFVRAEDPELAAPLVERVAAAIEAAGLPVARGVFGASMQVALVNDGPVTLIVERRPEGA